MEQPVAPEAMIDTAPAAPLDKEEVLHSVTVRGRQHQVSLKEAQAQYQSLSAYKAATADLARRRQALDIERSKLSARSQAAVSASFPPPAIETVTADDSEYAADAFFDAPAQSYLIALGFTKTDIIKRADPRAEIVLADAMAFRRHIAQLANRDTAKTSLSPARPEQHWADMEAMRIKALQGGLKEQVAYIKAKLGIT